MDMPYLDHVHHLDGIHYPNLISWMRSGTWYRVEVRSLYIMHPWLHQQSSVRIVRCCCLCTVVLMCMVLGCPTPGSGYPLVWRVWHLGMLYPTSHPEHLRDDDAVVCSWTSR